MLFNSYAFILLFLPVAVIGYFAIAKHSARAATLFLCVMSSVFYIWWKASFMLVLLLSMAINFYLGRYLMARLNQASTKRVLIAGLIFNIGMLGYFKYSNFFIANMSAVFGLDYSLLNIALPLGISFFTFTQIAFLVDAWRGRVVELSVANYFLFVTYFPHLLAGPIIHHREMMPQFADPTLKIINWDNIARGLILFTLGLTKKVLIADQIAPFANDGFASAATLTFVSAWATMLAYSCQLAFDFSGYTDMALGAALIMNIKLPQNFNAPFRATDIQDFWRRWHMTLSRFLRDYIYIPLGGNRRGEARMCLLFFVTFVTGGLWHGAAWTFVLWGALHGLALVVLYCWRKLGMPLPRLLAVGITFIFVICCFAIFRAASIADAVHILSAASGMKGLNLAMAMPAWSAALAVLAALILSFTPMTAHDIAQTIALNKRAVLITATLLLISLVLIPGATEFIYFIF